MRVDTDYVLTGTPTMPELAEWFEQGEEEQYNVSAIKRHLLTDDQRGWLKTEDLDVYDLLNGRFNAVQEPYILKMFEEWNAQLGKRIFGF